ncbi:MAG: hypothetical protein ACREQI_04060 [Candidatus Binataceae bacterium]
MHKWNFASLDDVRRFWLRVQEVPRRSEGRTHKQYERHYLGLYLLVLADNSLLSYPLKIEEPDSGDQKRKSPDFTLVSKSGETTGLEVVRATDEALQRWMSRAEKEHPEGAAILASPGGYVGDEIERQFCVSVLEVVKKKCANFKDYRPASRYDLLIPDDTRAGAGDRRKVLNMLIPPVRELKRKEPKLGKISVVASRDVLYDIGGESRIFPYIQWSAPELQGNDPAQTFSGRVELAGQAAAGRAIREHKRAGAPIYFMDGRGRLVKEEADGRRFEVRVREDGEEVTVQELAR